jgi:hypothetical protein
MNRLKNSICHSKAKTMKDTTISLYSRISLNRDFPEYSLKQGDIATFVDTVPDPEGIEEGYILEVFNALGESINVVTVPKSAVASLQLDEILSVRSLAKS